MLAEQRGFDGVCINEHRQNAHGNMPSPNLIASILARQTERAIPDATTPPPASGGVDALAGAQKRVPTAAMMAGALFMLR